MNTKMKFLNSLLKLWALTLTVTLLNLQLTAANLIENTTAVESVATEPAFKSITTANDMKVLRLITTAATIQLKVHEVNDEFGNKEALLTTGKQFEREGKAAQNTDAFSKTNLASTNTPLTITKQGKETLAIQQTTTNVEQKQWRNGEDEIKAATTTTKTTIRIQNKNNDELAKEVKENDLKQVTESTAQQQQQEQPLEKITTEVSRQKETDMQQQSTESARNAGNSLKITATVTTQPCSSASPNCKPHDITASTTSAHTHNPTTSLEARSRPHRVKQEEIAGDDVKPVSDEIESITLTLATDRQAAEDFKPIIKDANEKLIKERTIFSNKPEEWKQNLMPNEVDYLVNKSDKTYEHNINWSPYLHPVSPITDFTGKLLQERDGVITEIEQKFRLNEFDNANEAKSTKTPYETSSQTSSATTQTTTFYKEVKPASSYSVNHKILELNNNPILSKSPVQFIERRVKKSFDFPMHRAASDAQHLQQHFDFASTKFNSNTNEQPNMPEPPATNSNQQNKKTPPPARPQPEFSTTKFYNSKELYNELLQHKTKFQQPLPRAANDHVENLEELNNKVPSLTLNSFAVLHSPKIAKLEELHDIKEHQQQQKSLAIKKVTVKATKHKDMTSNTHESWATTPTSTSAASVETTANTNAMPMSRLSPSTLTEMPLAALVKTKKFQKELKRAQLLIKSMMSPQNSTTAAAKSNNSNSNSNSNSNEFKSIKETSATTNLPLSAQLRKETTITSHATNSPSTASYPSTTASPTRRTSLISSQTTSLSPSLSDAGAVAVAGATWHALWTTSTNPPKTSSHPISRPRILSRLQEKINSLECDLHNLPQDSHLWRGNETHELLLPIMICQPHWTPTSWFANNRWVIRNSRNCSAANGTPENCKNDKDCTAMMVSWEGESEIQSGDILIVEINDTLLTPKDVNLTTTPHNTQVYQVTRSGHEHCDVTEGILLDITPLIVDGRKLVTLYDKDLAEGVNLLIVVSELWGAQCVRLKVTTKTENCGESADCSGKGICYSNYEMEEYECQCCSGFAGPHCEEIDACTPSPCTNNGICVDLSQGHEGNSYQCLCPYGYTGKNCQYELDPCNSAECMNGGSCVGNSTHFRCECTPGYTGPLCQHSLNECESSPCIHGICVDEEDGFRCFCQPGFSGELCNFEYNECESNPCHNDGECIDHIGSYECRCGKGYTGINCQIMVDFCINKPCPEGHRCIDHGNDYSCECPGGRNGPDCNEMQRTQCNVNPCTHGGTCWSSGDSFYCACRPGYTGTMCEDEFVVETVVSSSEFIVDDTSARNFNDKSFGSSVVLKSPIELHNAYTAAIVLALVIFFVALYLIICHCKVNQTYRKFSTRTYGFLPILGFRLRTKQATSKINRHWLSGKGLGIGNAMRSATSSPASTSALHATMATSLQRNAAGHLPTAKATSATQQRTHVGQLNERPFQRHLAMNLENDMYYTVDFSENSQHSPLIQ